MKSVNYFLKHRKMVSQSLAFSPIQSLWHTIWMSWNNCSWKNGLPKDMFQLN